MSHIQPDPQHKSVENTHSTVNERGTYTLLFTDMEGSSDYGRSLGKDFEPIHQKHHEILDASADRWHGHILQRQGDSYFIAFGRAYEAASFALEVLRELKQVDWAAINPGVPKLLIRIGMHTDTLAQKPQEVTDRNYLGHPANRAHRVMEAAHGGQILCSETSWREMLDSGEKPASATMLSHGYFALKGVGVTELVQITGEGLQAKFNPPVRANRFGDAPPDAEAEKEYRIHLGKKLDTMELFGADLNEEERYPLEMAYISLRFQDQAADAESFFDRLEPENNLIHIEGNAGSGKSTLLKWLAVKAAGREERSFASWRESVYGGRKSERDQDFPERDVPSEEEMERYAKLWRFRLPFFIRLRDLATSKSSLTPLPQYIAETCKLDQNIVAERLKEGRCLLLIDGADEVPMKQRHDLWAEIETVVEAYGQKNIIVLSSRPMPGELAWLATHGAIHCQIADLADPEKLGLVRHWYVAIAEKFRRRGVLYHGMDADQLQERGERLQTELPHNEPAHELAKVPLLCALICALYALREDNPRLPETLPELCERACKMLLEKRYKESDVPVAEFGELYKRLDYNHKRRIAQKLAVSMVDRGLSELDFNNVVGIVHDELGSDQCPEEKDTEKFMQSFVVMSGVLRYGRGDAVEFLHNTLKEYLAAEHYLRTRTDDRLLYQSGSLNAANLLPFVANDTYESNRLLAMLLAPKKPYNADQQRAADLLFLRCYPLYSGRTRELKQAMQSLQEKYVPPKDEQEAIAVAAFGDEIVPQLAYNSEMEVEQAVACIQALRRIHSEDASKALDVYTDNENRHPVLEALTQFVNPLDIAWVRNRIVNCERDFEHIYLREEIYRQRITQSHFREFLRQYSGEQIISLILDNTQVSKIEGLEGVPQLQNLYLINTLVGKIEGLEPVPQLQNLGLNNTQVSKIEGLEPVPQLQNLGLNNTQVSKIEGLEPVPQLQNLGLSGTQVSKIEGLEPVPQLQNLDLMNTLVSKIEGLEGVPKLRRIDLDGTRVSHIEGLEHTPLLQSLDLRNTRVTPQEKAAFQKKGNGKLHVM